MSNESEILSSQIARRLGLTAEAKSPISSSSAERRQPAVRCAGCNASGTRLVFMSNGGDCCMSCAHDLAEMFGYRPVGMRADDVATLD